MTAAPARAYAGRSIVAGSAAGEVLASHTAMSLLLGVDVATGEVIDAHHPLRGANLAGKILVIPSGRGSCSGSGALLEMLLAGTAPAALVFCYPETILTLGAVVADEFFDLQLPVVRLAEADHRALRGAQSACVSDGVVILDPDRDVDPASYATEFPVADLEATAHPTAEQALHLSDEDTAKLAGEQGEAVQRAMRVVVRAAEIEGASELIDIEQAHIDGNFYQGRGSLEFAQALAAMGARVSVPTTCNSLTIDRARWRQIGVAEALGVAAEQVADAYVAMGVSPSYTCAPYLLEGRPAFGEQIAWAESNAVVYANSVLGARTLKYPDYLDVLIAIAGRAPAAGTHLLTARRATTRVKVTVPDVCDDTLFPMLGHLVGEISVNEIPVVCGLEHRDVSRDELREFGAAFATTSAAPMFHILGHTPEALTLEAAEGPDAPALRIVNVGVREFAGAYRELNTTASEQVGLVALGNPHLSLDEFCRVAELCAGARVADGVRLVITCGRAVRDRAEAAGFLAVLREAGAEVLVDTCWCFIERPIVPPETGAVMTNSAKYAHYAPGVVGVGVRFGGLDACLDAAFTGHAPLAPPVWCRQP